MMKKQTGRIVRSLSGFYDVQTQDGVVTCRGRGHLRRGSLTPLTGDMVEVTVEKGKGMVETILPRKNSFIRPAVANIDALVVFAANVNPITEPFLIDRVAAIAGDKEVPVILCVNKCDLDPALDLIQIYTAAGFPVIRASAETGEGVEQLRQLIDGKLVAFTGNSGVGKSSMLNRLCPHLELATGEVKSIAAETVILSLGTRDQQAMLAEYEAAGLNAVLVGSADAPGRIAGAIRGGFEKAWVFETE